MNCADVKQIYISRAETAHDEAYITKVFKRLNLGTIDEMQMIPKTNDKGHSYFGVRVRITLNPKSPVVKEMMKKFEHCEQAQIQHNPRYHWNVVRFVEKNYKEMIPAPVGFVNPTTESREAYEYIAPYALCEMQPIDYQPCFNPTIVSPEQIMVAIQAVQSIQAQMAALHKDDALFEIRLMDLHEQMAIYQEMLACIHAMTWEEYYYVAEYENYVNQLNALC